MAATWKRLAFTTELHNALTLGDAAIQAVLDLSGQALTLDSQAANTALRGPASGAAAAPTFRAEVEADKVPPQCAVYTTNAGQSIPNASSTIIFFEDLVSDAYTLVTGIGGVWKFNAAITGLYLVAAAACLDATAGWGANEVAGLSAFVDGVAIAQLDRQDGAEGAGVSHYKMLSGSRIVPMNAGSYLNIQIYQNSGAAITLLNSGLYNHVSITRL